MKTILFTGGGGAGTEALMSLLSDRYAVHFADADALARPSCVPASRWHVIPPAMGRYGLRNMEFLPAVERLCRERSVDVLVPGVDEELRAIAMPIARRQFHCAILLPDFDFVSRHLDKLASMKTLDKAGVPVPTTARLVPSKGVIDWPKFPCVLKPREGRGSRDVHLLFSLREAEAQLAASTRPAIDFITQELVVGQEYTVTMVADRSKRLRAVVPVRVDLKRGITLRAETDCDRHVIAACQRIHEADPFSGVVNVQVIKTRTAAGVLPFEINPRVSTTTCLAVAAGVDVIELACGEPSDYAGVVRFQNGLRLHRTWHTEFACAS